MARRRSDFYSREDRYGYWRVYVPVTERRYQAARAATKLAKKGVKVSPVEISGRTIARSFWGKAWCENLESYSDFANRLPRGRTYVRNGSVLDLQVAPGRVTALVQGSRTYEVEVRVGPVPPRGWKGIVKECAGQIDSVVELLQGRLSDAVMEVIARRKTGLFPSPGEIQMSCSCPDWAVLCKHVAASLYGIGARLDTQPEHLFVLRAVDPKELISQAGAASALEKGARSSKRKLLDESSLSEVFGIDIEEAPSEPAPRRTRARPTRRTSGRRGRT